MNTSDSIKSKMSIVEKRYAKTTKGTARRKPKPKLKLRPILKKDTVGIKGKITF